MSDSATTSTMPSEGVVPAPAVPVQPSAGADDPPALAGESRLGAALDPDDLVNRRLCAAVYLQGTYADHVARRLLGSSPSAICPPWGVDALWLARHANEARWLRRERDVRLGVVLAAVVTLMVALLGGGAAGRIDVVRTAVGCLLVACAGYAAAFALVFQHYRTIRRTAVSLAFDPEPRPAPPLVDAALEERLHALRDANTVVFSRDVLSPEKTFVGSGEWLDHGTMTVDISKGAKIARGKRREPETFDGYDLHEHLLAMVPKGLHPVPVAGHRLYVRGNSARVDTGAPVFPHGPVAGGIRELMVFRRPVNHVSSAVLERYLREPDDGARCYTTFEQRAWGGQVAVTLFVRARVVTRSILFVEIDVLRQQMLSDVFWDVDTIRLESADEVPALVRSVLPAAVPVLIGSVRRLWRTWREPRRELADITRTAKSLARFQHCELGTDGSLREDSSTGVLADTDRFPWADEEMFYQVLTVRVLDCVKGFLDSKGIDTSVFEEQKTTFVEKTTVNARDVYGSAVTKGKTKVKASGGSGARSEGGD
jgi:hypothetical protein